MAKRQPRGKKSTGKLPIMNTGVGELIYPWLSDPDKTYGGYKTQIKVPLDDANAQALLDAIDELNEGDYFPYDIDEDEGFVTFSAKTGEDYPPKLVDAKVNKIDPKRVKIFGGSKANIKVKLNRFDQGGNSGLNLRLNAVQVIDLVEARPDFEETDGYTGSTTVEGDSADDTDGGDF